MVPGKKLYSLHVFTSGDSVCPYAKSFSFACVTPDTNMRGNPTFTWKVMVLYWALALVKSSWRK